MIITKAARLFFSYFRRLLRLIINNNNDEYDDDDGRDADGSIREPIAGHRSGPSWRRLSGLIKHSGNPIPMYRSDSFGLLCGFGNQLSGNYQTLFFLPLFLL